MRRRIALLIAGVFATILGVGLVLTIKGEASLAAGLDVQATVVSLPNSDNDPVGVEFLYSGKPTTVFLDNYRDSPKPQMGDRIPVRVSRDGETVIDARIWRWGDVLVLVAMLVVVALGATYFAKTSRL